MNPFDLRAPEFLLFYFLFSLVVVITIVVLRNRAESGDAPRIDLGDPYLIAYLRGGEDEALRVAVITLLDRGILVIDGQLIRRGNHVTGDMVSRPIERVVLGKFSVPGEADSILKDKNLKTALRSYRYNLERAGLLPDAAARGARLKRLLLALTALGVAGVIKIQIGLSLERPVGFLLVMMIVAMAVVAAISFPRLTARGKATLEDITNLYSGLRTQVNSFGPGTASAELAMFAAVFGVAALAATPFAYAKDLFRRTTSSSSCGTSAGASSCGSSDGGSSCGSSSDGGSSCGGGGCGGCGGS